MKRNKNLFYFINKLIKIFVYKKEGKYIMKKLFKFAPLCALLLAAVAFILMMATKSLVYSNGNLSGWYDGPAAIFGKGQSQAAWGGISAAGEFEGKLAWNALLAWIFVLVALLALLIGSIMVFVKIKALEKFGGLIALVAGGLLLVAGIFLFFTLPAFAGANEWNNTDYFALGGGWIVAAILNILAGVVSAFPAVAALVEKK